MDDFQRRERENGLGVAPVDSLNCYTPREQEMNLFDNDPELSSFTQLDSALGPNLSSAQRGGYTEMTFITSDFDCELFPLADWLMDYFPEVSPNAIPGLYPAEYQPISDTDSSTTLMSNTLGDPPYLDSNTSLKINVSTLSPRTTPQTASSNGSGSANSPMMTPTSSLDAQGSLPQNTLGQPSIKSGHSSLGKRKFEDHLTSFLVDETTPPREIARPRVAFTPTRREQVAISREMGSCARCKVRRVAFNSPRPCKECFKSAGSNELARSLCVRDTFFDLRFGGFDILFESFSREFVESEIKRYHGPRTERKVYLILLFDENSPQKRVLPVTVRNYSTSDSEDKVLFHRLAADDGSFSVVPSTRYAIIANEIPSVQNILDWSQVTLTTTEANPAQRLITALHDFMVVYCQSTPRLPLLLHCWRSPKAIKSDSDNPQDYLAPKAVTSQILVVIKEGIAAEERSIHKTLEKLVYGGTGPGQANMIPLWACLWSLMLIYRDCMAVYKQYSKAPRLNTRQPGCSDCEMLISASKRMYDALTVNYAALFRVSSPLYLDWRVRTNFDLIGRDQVLKEAFYSLRTEVFWFYHNSDKLEGEDILLKTMVIEPEQKSKPHDPSILVAV